MSKSNYNTYVLISVLLLNIEMWMAIIALELEIGLGITWELGIVWNITRQLGFREGIPPPQECSSNQQIIP